MRRVNVGSPEFAYDDTDPEGFRSGMFRLGPLVGAQHLGATVYELPAGQALCPYHYEHGEEEWLLVVRGTATVRGPDGTEEPGPWDFAFFPKVPQGAHQVRNDSGEAVQVLMWSTVVLPTATTYPDSDKVGIWTGTKDDDVLVRRSSRVDYYDGERWPREE